MRSKVRPAKKKHNPEEWNPVRAWWPRKMRLAKALTPNTHEPAYVWVYFGERLEKKYFSLSNSPYHKGWNWRFPPGKDPHIVSELPNENKTEASKEEV